MKGAVILNEVKHFALTGGSRNFPSVINERL
jgi:hypothetical protein